MINWDKFRAQSETFKNNKPLPYMFIDGPLKQDVYDKLYSEWPSEDKFKFVKQTMKRYHHGPSRYFQDDVQHNHYFSELSETWNKFAEYVTSDEYMKNLGEITGLELSQLTEFSLVDGRKGDYIHPHVDTSASQYDNAKITSIYYFSKNWKREYGGTTCIFGDGSYDNIIFEPRNLDNTYIAFKQTDNAWHGYKRITVDSHRRAVLVTHG